MHRCLSQHPRPHCTHVCMTNQIIDSTVVRRKGELGLKVFLTPVQVAVTPQEIVGASVSHAVNGGSNPPGVATRKHEWVRCVTRVGVAKQRGKTIHAARSTSVCER